MSKYVFALCGVNCMAFNAGRADLTTVITKNLGKNIFLGQKISKAISKVVESKNYMHIIILIKGHSTS